MCGMVRLPLLTQVDATRRQKYHVLRTWSKFFHNIYIFFHNIYICNAAKNAKIWV